MAEPNTSPPEGTITLKYDKNLELQSWFEGDKDPAEEKPDSEEKPNSKDRDNGPWQVPYSSVREVLERTRSKSKKKPTTDKTLPNSELKKDESNEGFGANKGKPKEKMEIEESKVDFKAPGKKNKGQAQTEGKTTSKASNKKTLSDSELKKAEFDGFVATEKTEDIEICAPVASMVWTNRYNVPLVFPGEPSQPVVDVTFTLKEGQTRPKFTVPIYNGYTTSEDRTTDTIYDTEFVYTGKKENKQETQDQYILFSHLKRRLIEDCGKIYKEDWNAVAGKKMPFLVWTAKGERIQASKFLDATTKPLIPITDDRRLELQFHVFCDVARSAQRTPTESWTVMGRFWWSRITIDDLKSGKGFTLMFNEDAISESDLIKCMSAVNDKLKEGHGDKELANPWFILPVKDCVFVAHNADTWEKGRNDLKKEQFIVLGRHPRLIYEIWMDQSIVKSLHEKFRPPAYQPKTSLKPAQYQVLEDLDQTPSKGLGTETMITNSRISAARKYPRSSQDEVMKKMSATNLASSIWKDVDKLSGAAEWLHRSAFSFGGIIKPKSTLRGPGSSQVSGNLVLGTKETNTKMIRDEAFLKRFVQNTGQPVKLFTYLRAEPEDKASPNENKSNPKLATRLDYKPDLPQPKTDGFDDSQERKAVAAHRGILTTFHLLERQVPTLFEVHLDVEVDKVVYGWGGLNDKWKYKSPSAT